MNNKQSNIRHYSISSEELANFPNLRLLRRFEGGSVSLAESNDKFYVITNEGGMADFMDEGDQALAGNHATEFDTEDQRTEYLKQQGWIATPLNPDGVDSLWQKRKTSEMDMDSS